MSRRRHYLNHLFADAGFVELRHQVGTRWHTTWHTNPQSLLTEANQRGDIGNLFTSLHHVKSQPGGPISNDNVDRFCRLFLDFDPARPTGMSSTEDELQAALIRAAGLQRYLSGHAWPIPAVAISGNGTHLQYRVALPNNPETTDQLAVIYKVLAGKFGDDVVQFDRAVRNPGRLCALYGTVKRKGHPTKERPHRRSSVDVPYDWRQVTQRQIDQLANFLLKTLTREHYQVPQKQRGIAIGAGSGDYATLDVVGLFKAHGAYVRHITGNVHGVRCPWSLEHTTPSPADGADTVIFEGDGSWPGFACKHSHCADRTIRDLIALWDVDSFCARTFDRLSRGFSNKGVPHA